MKVKVIFSAVAAFLLSFATTLISCVKNRECEPTSLNPEDCGCILDNFVSNESANIIGKWKLEKTLVSRMGCRGYSHCNIVFEFKTNDVLTISGPPRVDYSGFRLTKGNHSFSLIAFDSGDYFQYRLYINGSNDPFFIRLSCDKMIMEKYSGTWYPFYILDRINQNINLR